MKLITYLSLIPVAILISSNHFASPLSAEDKGSFDVVIYGGTASGIAAAVQVRRMNKSVVVIEPTKRIGGLTTGGLGQTDIGNKAAIGGISREFYQAVRKHYENPANWRWQDRASYRGGGQSKTGSGEETMWTFEPSAALAILQRWVKENEIQVEYQQRLDRTGNTKSGEIARGVVFENGRIVAIKMESGRVYRGKMFLDATYEGDLLAAAGVSYTVGREGNDQYGETLNGVQTLNAKHHQFVAGVDPYVKPTVPSSGLLPGIDLEGPGKEGAADHRVQAYNFRMCLTDHLENRVPFAKPADYDPINYELLLRNFEAGETAAPWINSSMPNRKTDTNNSRGFSTDFIGQNYRFPEASYAEREQIIKEHRAYQQGLMWTLANHPRVPEKLRKMFSKWGTCKDEFEREDGWQNQLYVREGRRMIGQYVMTQHNCQGRELPTDPIGLAAYTMDSHNTQRYVDMKGQVRNEGDVEIGGFPPYPISYGALVPKRAQCRNLLVPVSLSATHISFGSIRMEPVFMVLGQTCATAACHAIDENAAVQDVDYEKLVKRLIEDKQRLEWAPTTRARQLAGIVVDDAQARHTGFSSKSSVIQPFVGSSYRHDENMNKGEQSSAFLLPIKQAGKYEVRISYSPNENRATNVPVTISHAGGQSTVKVNQRITPKIDSFFESLGTFEFDPEQMPSITVSNKGTDGYVIVDAVQAIRVTK